MDGFEIAERLIRDRAAMYGLVAVTIVWRQLIWSRMYVGQVLFEDQAGNIVLEAPTIDELADHVQVRADRIEPRGWDLCQFPWEIDPQVRRLAMYWGRST